MNKPVYVPVEGVLSCISDFSSREIWTKNGQMLKKQRDFNAKNWSHLGMDFYLRIQISPPTKLMIQKWFRWRLYFLQRIESRCFQNQSKKFLQSKALSAICTVQVNIISIAEKKVISLKDGRRKIWHQR